MRVKKIRTLGMPYENERRERERGGEKERAREKEKGGEVGRRDGRRPPSAPLWINYPESSRGAAPWRIASTPSHVFVNSHSGLRAGCRSTALKYLSIIRSVRAEPRATPPRLDFDRAPSFERSRRESAIVQRDGPNVCSPTRRSPHAIVSAG